jgi:LysM repeat protein
MKKLLYIISTFLALTPPIGAVAFTYTIQPGDTLSDIARSNNVAVQSLVDANNIANPDLIIAGRSLDIPEEELVGGSGGSYTPVTGYQSRLSVFLSSSASTINVASTKDPSGQQISIADVSSSSSARIYFDIAPGTSKEEIIYCTGVTATTWTGCVRGLGFQGGTMTASTTLAYAHNAGTSIVISNVGQFYTEYLSRTGNQDVYDIKTFYNYPKFAVTTTVPVLASEFATKYYVDNVGAGGFTASNVSTTRGLSVDGSVPEKVGINASTTKALAFDSSGKIYVNASSTKALAFDSNGALYFNEAQNLNLTGTNTFSGNVTTTGRFTVNAPTSTRDATNLGYVDNAITVFSATGTAGEAITAGRALYISTTSTIFQTDTSAASSTFKFIGIAAASAAVNGTVSYVRTGGTICNQSGLTPGDLQFLNGSAGRVAATATTLFARIGVAVSSNCIQVSQPKYFRTGSRNVAGAGTGNYYDAVGFYPSKITLYAAPQGFASSGGSISDEAGLLIIALQGSTTGAVATNAALNVYCYDANTSALECFGSVTTKTPNGFITNISTASVAFTYNWTAESD